MTPFFLAIAVLLESCSVGSGGFRSTEFNSAKVRSSINDVTRQNELAAIRKLESLARGEAIFFTDNNRYGTFNELVEHNLLELENSLMESAGYRFNLAVTPDRQDFTAVATPAEYGKTGVLSFFVDRNGMLRGADKRGAQATAEDPPAPRPQGSVSDNELAAIKKLRAFSIAEAMCFAEQAQYATLEQMVRQGSLQGGIATAESEGYRFSLTVTRELLNFSANAVPIRYGETGLHSFFVSDDGVVRMADRNGAPATAHDPVAQ